MENNKKIEQIVDNCYKFILDFQQKERNKVTQDEQALLSCQLSIIATLNDVAIKQVKSKHSVINIAKNTRLANLKTL